MFNYSYNKQAHLNIRLNKGQINSLWYESKRQNFEQKVCKNQWNTETLKKDEHIGWWREMRPKVCPWTLTRLNRANLLPTLSRSAESDWVRSIKFN